MDLEEELFNMQEGFYNPKFKRQIKKEIHHIKHFCNKYKVELLSVNFITENGYLEPAYLFSDNLGHYTIDGIKRSLFDILSSLN